MTRYTALQLHNLARLVALLFLLIVLATQTLWLNASETVELVLFFASIVMMLLLAFGLPPLLLRRHFRPLQIKRLRKIHELSTQYGWIMLGVMLGCMLVWTIAWQAIANRLPEQHFVNLLINDPFFRPAFISLFPIISVQIWHSYRILRQRQLRRTSQSIPFQAA